MLYLFNNLLTLYAYYIKLLTLYAYYINLLTHYAYYSNLLTLYAYDILFHFSLKRMDRVCCRSNLFIFLQTIPAMVNLNLY